MSLKALIFCFLFASLSTSYPKDLVYRFDNLVVLDEVNPRRGFTMNFDKYLFNGDIIEGMSLKSKSGVSTVFWVDTWVQLEEVKNFLTGKPTFKELKGILKTFSDNELSEKFEASWMLLIKDRNNKYKPVMLKVRFTGSSVEDYKVDNFDILVGSPIRSNGK